MILGCICGGVLEFGIYAIMSIVGPVFGVWWVNAKNAANSRQHKKSICPCDCHDEPLDTQLKVL